MDNSLDLGINGYYHFELFGKTFWLTNTHISIIIIVSVITILAILANRVIKKADPAKKPGKAMNVIELVVEAIDSITRSNMGDKHFFGFCNYIGTLMIFLVLSNTVGVFGLRPPTADYGITLGLALITFFLIHINGFRYQKMKHLTELFHPIPLTPINIIGELATPVSMSLRLFGNILSGTIIMALIYGLLPKFMLLFWPGVLHIYFDLFSGAIQAFVFCMLTMVFISKNFDD
ncbi:MAG: F0F1 ATP synthase subunit A [Lachnospiraceae bacterium]|nr:F0F1 ATP synthase subunit A [Lachnospiraceae bacterium]